MDGDADPGGARRRPVHRRSLLLRQDRQESSQPENAGSASARDQRQTSGADPYERRHARTAATNCLTPPPTTAWSSSSSHAFARLSIESHDGAGVCHRGSRDGREPDHAADRHRLDDGDRTARRRHAARRRRDGLGAVRLHLLAVRVPAHEHGRLHGAVAGRRRDKRIARDPGARLHRRGADRHGAHRAADPAGDGVARRDGRQRGRHPRRQNLFHDPDLVGAAGARQLCRARLADRTGPRQTGAGHPDHHQPDQRGGDGAAGAGVRLRHCRRGDRRLDRGSGRPPARRRDRAAPAGIDWRCRARRCSTAPN